MTLVFNHYLLKTVIEYPWCELKPDARIYLESWKILKISDERRWNLNVIEYLSVGEHKYRIALNSSRGDN